MPCPDCIEKDRPKHLTSIDFQLRELLPETIPIPTELHTMVANGEAHRDTLGVFLALWRFMDASGKSSPLYSEIAGASGMSKSHAARMVAQLVDLGFAIKSQRKVRDGRLKNAYTLSFSRLDAPKS